ncbi:Survival motor neuron-like protein 1 [Fusarium austroafricanum]|uniref:Survival motor neuron-like protein 1 n=1 Tax=Fusarium austroafricanum TaxID=2364996 RepID=A0A8H4NU68_9HYPO|nr:Survival motor neuron-like protein 1 [Fusarium austroafricanum]
MPKKQEKLTHEEMWDDSALIDSWNEALQEYKVLKHTYSIHAKGGSVRELESQSCVEVEAESESEQPQVTETEEETMLKSEAVEQDKENPSSPDESKGPIASQSLPSFPIQTVLGSVQDESLKKLLMSWYYAGYYTGLYEGQQQAQKNSGS